MNTVDINNHDLYPFIFDQIRLKEACWINGVPYFTRRAIGEFLGYANPHQAIRKIIDRNPYIDDDRWSLVVKLPTELKNDRRSSVPKTGTELIDERHSVVPVAGTTEQRNNQFSVPVKLSGTDGKEYEIRVYNPIGLQLIMFESRQPTARFYKVAVAHLTYAFMRGELIPPRNIAAQSLYLQCKDALSLVPYVERPVAVKYLCEKYEKSDATIYRWMKRIERGENPAETKSHRNRGRTSISKEMEQEIVCLVEQDPRITVKKILELMPGAGCTSTATIYRIKKGVKEQLRQRVIGKLEGAGLTH